MTNDTIYGIINKADPCSFRSCLPSASATKFQLTRKAMPSLATFSIDSPSNYKSLSLDATEFLQLSDFIFTNVSTNVTKRNIPNEFQRISKNEKNVSYDVSTERENLCVLTRSDTYTTIELNAFAI